MKAKLFLAALCVACLTGCAVHESETIEVGAVVGALGEEIANVVTAEVDTFGDVVEDSTVTAACSEEVAWSNDGVASAKQGVDIPSDIALGEVTIAMSHFGTSYVSPSELFADLGPLAENIDEASFENLGVLVNNFSVQGFERLLASGNNELGYNVACVALCVVLEIPYEPLWADGFMSLEVVQSIVDQFGMAG